MYLQYRLLIHCWHTADCSVDCSVHCAYTACTLHIHCQQVTVYLQCTCSLHCSYTACTIHFGLGKFFNFPPVFPTLVFLLSNIPVPIFHFLNFLSVYNQLFAFTFLYLLVALTTQYTKLKSVHNIHILILCYLTENVGKNSCVFHFYRNFNSHRITVFNWTCGMILEWGKLAEKHHKKYPANRPLIHCSSKIHYYYLTRALSEPTSDIGKAGIGNWVWAGLVQNCSQNLEGRFQFQLRYCLLW